MDHAQLLYSVSSNTVVRFDETEPNPVFAKGCLLKFACVAILGALLASAVATAANLDVRITNGQASAVTVLPGASFGYEIRGVLTDSANRGLAVLLFDLSFDGGSLSPVNAPKGLPMSSFAAPSGVTNPGGFGGTSIGGSLVQVGGLQNIFNNTTATAPTPVGPVTLNVAHGETVLASGMVVAPAVAGVYILSISNVVGAVIDAGSDGIPIWSISPVPMGAVTNLIIVVDNNALPLAQAAGVGPRYLSVTAPPGVGSVALLIGGNAADSNVSCLSKYLQADGTLGDVPFFQDSALWATTTFTDTAILPSTSYTAQVDYGGGTFSPTATAVTFPWGDPNDNGIVNIFDLFCILDAFSGDFNTCSPFSVDMVGDNNAPDGVINIFDLFVVLDVFAGVPFSGPPPCIAPTIP